MVRLRVMLPVCEMTCMITDVVLTVNYAPVYSRVWFPDRLLKCRVRYTVFLSRFHVALRPRRRDGLLGTGTEWEGDDRVKARPRKPSEKDRRDRGPPPKQWKC